MSEQLTTAEKKNQKPAPRRAYTPYTALTLDENYCVSTYGDAASNLFGHPEATMVGKPVSQILPDLVSKLEKSPAKRSSPIRLNEVPMKAKHADGNTFPVMIGLRQDHMHGSCRHLVLVRNLVERSEA